MIIARASRTSRRRSFFASVQMTMGMFYDIAAPLAV
jgi:hypothetical protein